MDNFNQQQQPTPHRWAEVIKAWADGKTIQIYIPAIKEWSDYRDGFHIAPMSYDGYTNYNYRIKPEQKTGWINIYPASENYWHGVDAYKDYVEANSGGVYSTREMADIAHSQHSTLRTSRIACIQITYTEGEGL